MTTPTSLPSLTSSNLDAVMSTGALGISNVAGSPAFAGTALVKATGSTTDPVHVKVGTCLADGGSILAVDMTGTTGATVQLVGSLVSQPFLASTGADTYLFRGNVIQLAGAVIPGTRLPWGLAPGFVAEVQVQPKAKSGSLSVLFGEPQEPAASTTSTGPATTSTTASATSSATGASTSAASTATSSSTSSSSVPPGVMGGGSTRSL